MKHFLFFSILIMVLLSGCTQQPATDGNSSGDPSPVAGGEIKEFSITAKDWVFDPDTITVNRGDTVKLHITSVDVMHGFGLPDFGINERIEAGKTIDVQFVADKTGTFDFSCTVFCGSGHSRMKGQLIVK